jgi:hypothetical protein
MGTGFSAALADAPTMEDEHLSSYLLKKQTTE